MAFEPWDRQPRETSRAYALFAQYRDAGPLERSFAKVAREFSRKMSTITTIARRYDWVARAAAWDAENERIKRNSQVKEIEGMARRQVLAGMLFQNKALKRIQGLTDEEINLLSLWEAMRLFELGVRTERVGRGEPGDMTPVLHQQNLIIGGMEAPIIELLRKNPTRVGPVVELLAQLQAALPELSEDSPVYYDAEDPDLADLVDGAEESQQEEEPEA